MPQRGARRELSTEFGFETVAGEAAMGNQMSRDRGQSEWTVAGMLSLHMWLWNDD